MTSTIIRWIIKIIIVIVVILILIWLIVRFTLAPEDRGSWLPINWFTREVRDDSGLDSGVVPAPVIDGQETPIQPVPTDGENEEIPDIYRTESYFAETVSFMGEINLNNQDLDLGTGSIFATNILYGIESGVGISVSDGQTPVITNEGVLSVAGQSGNINLSGGNGIQVEGLNIANLGVLSLAGQTGDVNLEEGSDIEIDGLNIGLKSVLSNLSQINLPNSSNPITIGGISLGRSGDSLLWNGNMVVDSENMSTFGVSSLNDANGALTLANATEAGGTITIDDATTGAKGIASFSPANFTVTDGAVNTIQNIHTSATPQFTRLGIGKAADGTITLDINGDARIANGSDLLFGTSGLLSDIIGNRTYTEQNYIANNQSITASLEALDVGLSAAASGGVSLINGTANQITASNPTGNVTLSIPTDFRAPGTVNAVSGIYTGAGAGTQRIDASGNLVNIGNLTALGTITGNGSGLTNLNASNLSSGIVPDAQITGSYTGLTNLTGSGTATFNAFIGDGSALTGLNADNITTGTLTAAGGGTGLNSYTAGNFIRALNATTLEQRTPAQVLSDIGAEGSFSKGDLIQGTGVTLTGTLTNRLVGSGNITFALDAGINDLNDVNITAPANTHLLQYSAGNWINVSGISAGLLTSGTLSDSVLSTNVTVQGNTFNGANQLVQLNGSTQLPAVSGALLTNLNANNLSSGTVANSLLVNSGALTVTAGTGLTGGGSVALGGTTTLDIDTNYLDTNYFTQSGNTFGATGILGTNDNFGFNLRTNGIDRITISNAGAVNVNGSTTVDGNLTITAANDLILGTTGLLSNIIGNRTYTQQNYVTNSQTLTASIDALDVALNTVATSSGVSSINGTANQITASSPTGAVTLSIPTDFRAPGTINAVNGLYTGAGAGTQRIDASGNLVNIGNITAAGTITGNGSGLTNLNASNLSSGTVPDTQITGSYTGLTNLTGSGTATFNAFAGNGSALTNLNASNITTGTIANSLISGNYTNIANLTASGTITFSNLGAGVVHSNGSGVLSNVLGTTGYVPVWTATGLSTTSTIFDDGTNVGINSVNPGRVFDVRTGSGDGDTGNGLRITDPVSGGNNKIISGRTLNQIEFYYETMANTQAAIRLVNYNTSGTNWGTTVSRQRAGLSFDTVFQGVVSERLTIMDNGNVGIGTVGPNRGLEVSTGTTVGIDVIRASESADPTNRYMDIGSGGLNLVRQSGSAAGMTLMTSLSSGSWGTDGGGIVFSPRGNPAVSIAGATGHTSFSGMIHAVGSNTITSNPPAPPANNVGWKLGLWGTNYAVGIASNTFALKTGTNVSFFTGNPAGDATGAIPDSNAYFTASINDLRIGGQNTNDTSLWLQRSGTAHSWRFRNTGGNLLFMGGDNAASLVRMSIDTAGNVNVANNLSVSGTISGNGSGLTALNASNLSSGFVPDARISGSYTGMVSLTGSGNVDFARFLGNAADTAGAPSFSWTGDGDTGMYRAGTNILGLSTAGVDRLRIIANGNVGIGNNSPDYKLDVNGTFSSNDLAVIYQNNNFYSGQVAQDVRFTWTTGDTQASSMGTYLLTWNNRETHASYILNVKKGYQAGYSVSMTKVGGNGDAGYDTITNNSTTLELLFKLNISSATHQCCGPTFTVTVLEEETANKRPTIVAENRPGGWTAPTLPNNYLGSGNVGIGTSSPNSKLEVRNGGFRLSSSVGTAVTEFFPASSGSPTKVGEIYGTHSAPSGLLKGIIVGLNAGNHFGVTGSVETTDLATIHGIKNSAVFDGTLLRVQNTGGELTRYGVAVSGETQNYFTGSLGVGSTNPAQKLQVIGNIRVGTSGTNGCVQRFDGASLTGTCASDMVLKTNVSSFDSILDRYAQLNPVTYNWSEEGVEVLKADSTSINYGLISQEVAQLFPELVADLDTGYKGIHYHMLPIYNIQAIKELNTVVQDNFSLSNVRLDNLEDTVAALSNLTSEINFDSELAQSESLGFESILNRVDSLENQFAAMSGNFDTNSPVQNPIDQTETYPTFDSSLELGELINIEDGQAARTTSDSMQPAIGVASNAPQLSSAQSSQENYFCSLVDTDQDAALQMFLDENKDNFHGIIDMELFESYAAMCEESLVGTELEVEVVVSGKSVVKVDVSNGEIKTGDFLVASPATPGRAAKAIEEGWVIGRAIKDATEESVSAIIFSSWYPGEDGETLALNPTLSTEMSGSPILASLQVDGDSVFYGKLNVLGESTFADIAVTGNLNLGLLSFDSTNNSINSLGMPLKLQDKFGAGNIDIFNGNIVMTPDGNIESKGLIQASRIEAAEIKVETIEVAEAEINSIEIKDGITMRDRSTGDFYCIVIDNGNIKEYPGRCD